jgi:hypothetical protein
MSEIQSPSNENEFNTEIFIQEIENRPVLWDMSKREYGDRVLKRKAWEELCILFIPHFETKTTKEKNEEGKCKSFIFYYFAMVMLHDLKQSNQRIYFFQRNLLITV